MRWLTTSIKRIVSTYDAVTLPVYYLVQQPWKTLREAKKQRAQQLVPGDPYSAWTRKDAPEMPAISSDETLVRYLKKAFQTYSTKKCLGFRETIDEKEHILEDGKKVVKKKLASDYTWYTYAEVDKKVDNLTKVLNELGVRPRDVVLIFMETRIEWMLAFIALNRMGATVATLINTLGHEGIIHGANLVESKVLLTSATLLPTVDAVCPQLRYVKTVAYVENIRGRVVQTKNKFHVVRLPVLHSQTNKVYTENVHMQKSSPQDEVLIMFTSGSTGTPKGVVFDSKAIMDGVHSVHYIFRGPMENQCCLAYLPLGHLMEFISEIVLMGTGNQIGYSSPFTMTDSSSGLMKGTKGDIAILRPTVMAAVPLILEKIRKAIMDKARSMGQVFVEMLEYAVEYKFKWTIMGYRTPLLDIIVFGKIRQGFGGRLSVLLTGSAPLSLETEKFIAAVLGQKIIKGYGVTETVAGNVASDVCSLLYERVGYPVSNFHIKLVPWPEGSCFPTDRPNGRGEIHIGGPYIAKGYYKNEELTKEAFYKDAELNWFKTGDIGEIFPDGSLRIIDRAKGIVKLMNGEFVSLGKVEAALHKSEYVEIVCIYANSLADYVVALVSPNAVKLKAVATTIGKDHLHNLRDMCSDKDLCQIVLSSLKRTALEAKLSRCETPQKLLLCPEEWSPASRLLTGSMKLKRKQLYDFYKLKISELYTNNKG